ncbi:MAG: hypothetical protein ACRCVY_06830 [Commensalibacter sp.]
MQVVDSLLKNYWLVPKRLSMIFWIMVSEIPIKERQNVEPEKELDQKQMLKEAKGIANSGKQFFKKIDNFSGDLVKIQPPEFSKLIPTTIYFTTEEELSKAAEIARTGGLE